MDSLEEVDVRLPPNAAHNPNIDQNQEYVFDHYGPIGSPQNSENIKPFDHFDLTDQTRCANSKHTIAVQYWCPTAQKWHFGHQLIQSMLTRTREIV